MSEGRNRVSLSAIRERFAVDTVRRVPYALYSGVLGWGARKKLPRAIRKPLYAAFSRAVGADPTEAELELADYESFDNFFARRLRVGARVLCDDPKAILSPSDGVVSFHGDVAQGMAIQAKGLSYSVAELLGDDALAQRFFGGSFLTVYLSPRDYHRVHTPVAGKIVKYRHMPGKLLPVSPFFVTGVEGLYARNERVVIELDTTLGKVAVIMVAAAGVGNLVLYAPPAEFRDRRRAAEPSEVALHPPLPVARGQELGAFLLGSTVIMLFEPGAVQFSGVESGQAVRAGRCHRQRTGEDGVSKPETRTTKGRKKGALRVPSDQVPRRGSEDEDVDVSDISVSVQNDNGIDSAENYADGSIEVGEDVIATTEERRADTVSDPVTEVEASAIEQSEPAALLPRASTEAIGESDLEEVRDAVAAANQNADGDEPRESGAPLAEMDFKPSAEIPLSRPAEMGPPPPPPKKGPPPAPTPGTSAVRAPARPRAWHDDIFDEDYLRTLPLLTPVATQNEANFVLDSLALEPGAQILDAGCGYGRHAMELAARGYQIVGLDNSLPLLLRGAEEAQRRGLSIHFVHGDMRDITFDSQFDGAYCIFNTFGYFDDDTNKKTAHNLARSLKPGARLVVDVLNRDYVIADLPSRVWWEGEGCVVLEEVDFNYFSSRVISNRSLVFDDGRQIEQEISIRSFSLHELGKLLHSAGLRVLEISGSMATRGRFFGAQSRDLVVVAERR